MVDFDGKHIVIPGWDGVSRQIDELWRLGPIESSTYGTGTSLTTQPGTGAMRPYGVPAPVAWLMARYM